jgi:hypothetical protein
MGAGEKFTFWIRLRCYARLDRVRKSKVVRLGYTGVRLGSLLGDLVWLELKMN